MARRATGWRRPSREEQRQRIADGGTERLARRATVMAAFTTEPGRVLDPDQISEQTGLPAHQVKGILKSLTVDGWLRQTRNDLGHPAWRRTTEDDGESSAPAARPVSVALRPGDREFFCKGCRRGVVAADPPDGWLRLQLREPGREARDGRSWSTTALLCGLPCLRVWAASASEVRV